MSYEVSCVGSASGLDVEVTTVTWEADHVGVAGDVDANGVNNADEDRIGSATTNRASRHRRQQARRRPGVLPHTDTDFDEEVDHEVKLRVTSGPVTGTWPPRLIHARLVKLGVEAVRAVPRLTPRTDHIGRSRRVSARPPSGSCLA